MHDQIGVTTDGRCEMRIVAKVQAEVADVIRRINGLRLRPQNDGRNHLVIFAVFDVMQNFIERRWLGYLAFWKRNIERIQKFRQGNQLFA